MQVGTERSKANPGKFQALPVGKKTKNEGLCFNFENFEIKCDDSVKPLDVSIDFRLGFDEYVSNLCKKASRQLNVLKRIGKHLCKLGKFSMFYQTLTWHFCGETNTKKIEKIQERELHFIYNDYVSDYESLFLKSKLHILKVRRLRTMANF